MKRLAFGILCVAGCVLLMSHNTFARNYDNTINVTSKLSGQYGAYVNGSYYRYQNFNSYTPVELLTGVSQRSKFLYGTSVSFPVTLDNKENHYIKLHMKFSTNGADADFYNINEHYVGYKTDNSSSSYTEFTNTLMCQVNTSQQVQIKYMDVTCEMTFTEGVVPVAFLFQYGTVGNFTHEVTSPIAISTGSSIYIQALDYSWSSGGGSDNTDVVNGLGEINDTLENQFDKENEAIDNIDGQTAPSSGSGENSTTTNLIGVFSSFVTALGGLSATDCNLTLDFPSYAGGTRVVNVCQNKDKAGNLISVFSSLTLIVFYVPLAIKLLTMIYNEIRSFTNG